MKHIFTQSLKGILHINELTQKDIPKFTESNKLLRLDHVVAGQGAVQLELEAGSAASAPPGSVVGDRLWIIGLVLAMDTCPGAATSPARPQARDVGRRHEAKQQHWDNRACLGPQVQPGRPLSRLGRPGWHHQRYLDLLGLHIKISNNDDYKSGVLRMMMRCRACSLCAQRPVGTRAAARKARRLGKAFTRNTHARPRARNSRFQ
jgi:hypothetical protein